MSHASLVTAALALTFVISCGSGDESRKAQPGPDGGTGGAVEDASGGPSSGGRGSGGKGGVVGSGGSEADASIAAGGAGGTDGTGGATAGGTSGDGGTAAGGAGGTDGNGGSSADGGCLEEVSGAVATATWASSFGTDLNDRAEDVFTSSDGVVFISGSTDGALGPVNPPAQDGFIRKMTADQGVSWTHQFGTLSTDNARAVVVDGTSDLYVGGVTAGNLAGTNAGKFDGFVQRLTDGASAPTVEWTHQFGTTEDDYVLDIALGYTFILTGPTLRAIYAVGRTLSDLDGAGEAGAAGGSDAYVRKLSPDGDESWTRQFGTTANDQANAVATDALGAVYVVGVTAGNLEDPGGPSVTGDHLFVRKMTSSGDVLWTKQPGAGLAIDVAVNVTNGDVYVVGYLEGDFGCRTDAGVNAVLKFDTAGALQWVRRLPGMTAESVFLGNGGTIYLAGPGTQANQVGTAAIVRKLDAEGNALWSAEALATAEDDFATGVTLNLAGNLYAVGFGGPINDRDAFLARLAP